MRTHHVANLVLALGFCLFPAADPTPPRIDAIRLPVIPGPAPTPVPAPTDTYVLLPGELYVIDCSVPCRVRAVPGDFLTITRKSGPRDVTAKFVGGGGIEEDRTYAGPILYLIKSTGKSGRVVVDVVPYGFTDDKDARTFTIDVGPQSPPVPDPRPLPKPEPASPAKLFVVIVEETAAAVAARGAMLADPALATRMKEKGHRWRVVDRDVADVDGQPPADVKRFLEASAGKTYPQLFLVNERGETVLSGDLPKTAAGLLDTLKKAGG